uniref:Uncharacterized protein n=1 Tax=Ornithodoros coriaceus TaxID=92741 RepID=B2D298_ORNCO|nr:hypothetical protein [Ornithodoros coriaceus]
MLSSSSVRSFAWNEDLSDHSSLPSSFERRTVRTESRGGPSCVATEPVVLVAPLKPRTRSLRGNTPPAQRKARPVQSRPLPRHAAMLPSNGVQDCSTSLRPVGDFSDFVVKPLGCAKEALSTQLDSELLERVWEGVIRRRMSEATYKDNDLSRYVDDKHLYCALRENDVPTIIGVLKKTDLGNTLYATYVSPEVLTVAMERIAMIGFVGPTRKGHYLSAQHVDAVFLPGHDDPLPLFSFLS